MKKISIICIAALFLLVGCKGNSEDKTVSSSNSTTATDKTEALDKKSEDSSETSATDIKNESKSSNANVFNEDNLEISYHSEVSSDDSIKPESESEKTNPEKQEEKVSKIESSTDAPETSVDEEEIELPFITLE